MEKAANSAQLFSVRWTMISGFIFLILILINFLAQNNLKDLTSSNLSSNISGIYLRVLIKIDPEDIEARKMLARHYYVSGKWNDAYNTLLPILNNNSDWDIKKLLFDIHQKQFFIINPDNENYSILKSSLISVLNYIIDNIHVINKSELVYYAEFSMQLSRPDIATVIYKYLADNDSNRASYWLNLAAEAQIANSQPDRSAQLYHMAFLKSNTDTAVYYAHKALESFVSANMIKEALAYLPLYIDRFPSDIGFLEKGRDLGLATENYNLALAMSKRLIDTNTDNIEYQYKHAQIAEWSHKYDTALSQWKKIALDYKDYAAYDRAIQLSKGTSDYTSLIVLLKSKSLSKLLSKYELDDIIFAYVKNKDEHSAIAFLREYTQRYNNHIYALQSLAYLYEKYNEIANAISTWIKIKKYSSNQIDSIIKIAELAIKNNDKEFAHSIMLDDIDINDINNKRYFEILGSLSWDLNKVSIAKMAYSKLLSIDETNIFYKERLIILYAKEKLYKKAVDLAVEVYGDGKHPRFLLLAIDILISISDWTSVKTQLLAAKEKEIIFNDIELYWLQNALAAIHEQEYSKAEECYNRAINLNPVSRSAEIGLLWLYIETDDKKRLTEYFTRTEYTNASSSPEYWRVYALALSKLGWNDQAQHWFQLLVSNNNHDMSILKSFSETLSYAGKIDSAARINNYIFSSQRKKLVQTLNSLKP